MIKLLREIRENSSLESLSLGYNQILEEQPTVLTDDQIESGQTEVELSEFNMEVISCFKNFIKYNTYLIHIDLTMTGLIEPALKFLTALLRKSQALRCLHLCGNIGISPKLIHWIYRRIHAKEMK